MRLIPLNQLQQFAAVNLTEDLGAVGGHRHVPQCADLILKFGLDDGKIGHIVMTGRYAGVFAGSVAQANSIFTSMTTGATFTALQAHLATTVRINGLDIRDINPEDGTGQLISSNTTGPLGTSTGTPLPAEVALVITKRTAKAGRQFRGRMYFPGWATTALGAGNLANAAAVTALQNWANSNVGSAMAAAGYTHVLAQLKRAAYTSPKTGTDFEARPAGSVDITSLVVKDDHWDTQRKRGLK